MERITIEDKRYPELLKRIPKAPKELYCIGDVSLLQKPQIAVVGARKHSPYGHRVAKRIAKTLAAHDVVLTSGLAMGIDSCGHRAMVESGGKTIAVLGCGIDLYYPAVNTALRRDIERTGLVITEYPPGTRGSRWTFPERNRIISGLSLATIVVEAGPGSGSLITADLATAQGRTVYTVPGNIDSLYSVGCNILLADGVMPMLTPEDVLRDLGLLKTQDPSAMPEDLGEAEAAVVHLLRERGEMTVDELARVLRSVPAKVNALVGILEIKGYVATALGKIFLVQ